MVVRQPLLQRRWQQQLLVGFVGKVGFAHQRLSLALYLQMVGRGLRPKSNGNCLILDMAGNVEKHGLPDDGRQWSLEPRRQQNEDGAPPVVTCLDCAGVSPAASRNCQFCESSFGKVCQRCGAWRAWKRWSAETYCGDFHDLVCNLCHPDAHKLANLPVQEGLKGMLKEEPDEGQPEANPSNLQTVDAVRDRLCDVAEKLVYAMKIGDMATFTRLLDRLTPLLRREKQLRKARMAKMEAELEAKSDTLIRDVLDNLEQKGIGGVTFVEVNLKEGYARLYDKDGKPLRGGQPER